MSKSPTLDRLYDTALARNTDPNPSKEDFFDSLNADERFAVHVLNLNSQWCNGGLMQYFDNRYGSAETLGYLDRALRRVGTPSALRVAAMLAEADEAYDSFGCSSHASEREMERGRDATAGKLDPLDDEYFGPLGDTFMADCEAYATKGSA